jgi:DnaA family protein
VVDYNLLDLQKQMPLDLSIRDPLNFENYHPGPNAFITTYLQRVVSQGTPASIYLYGAPTSGKSHLLHASCLAAVEQGRRAIYLPMRLLQHEPPELLGGLEHADLVCLDDIHAIAGRQGWEHALFHFYNRLQEYEVPLLVAASSPPVQLGLELPDLSSRLQALEIYQVQVLDDADRLLALQMRARQRGLILPDASAHYLLSHHPRGFSELLTLLDSLDALSLAAQRRLTIPFLRQVLLTDTPSPSRLLPAGSEFGGAWEQNRSNE